jgi:hypothetical protein
VLTVKAGRSLNLCDVASGVRRAATPVYVDVDEAGDDHRIGQVDIGGMWRCARTAAHDLIA